jgi:hypothetical protein
MYFIECGEVKVGLQLGVGHDPLVRLVHLGQLGQRLVGLLRARPEAVAVRTTTEELSPSVSPVLLGRAGPPG